MGKGFTPTLMIKEQPLGMDMLLLQWVFVFGWGIFESLSLEPFPKVGYHHEMAEV